jgi:hypothetical protein
MSVTGESRASGAVRRLGFVITILLYTAVIAGPGGVVTAAGRSSAAGDAGSAVAASRHGATAEHRPHKRSHKKKCPSRQRRRSKKPPCTILPTFEGAPEALHITDGGLLSASPHQPFAEGVDENELSEIPVGPFIAAPPRPVQPIPVPEEAGPSEQTLRSADGADALGLQIVRNIDLKRGPEFAMPVSSILEDDDGSEQSVATNGRGLVLYTTNSRNGFSINGGRTFFGLDPTTIFPEDESFGGFCCDQVVTYVPSVDRFVWVLQYYEGGGGFVDETQPNEIRVATATSAQFLASNATSWQYYDWTPSDLGALPPGPGTTPFLDRPHVAFSHGMLYLSVSFGWNPNGFVYGYALWRFPLAQLGTTISPTVIQSQSTSIENAGYFSPYAPAQNNIFNNPPIQYFATRLSTSSLGLVAWADRGSPVFYEIDVPSIANKNKKTEGPPPPSSDWAARALGQAGVVVTGARTGRVAWFGWSAGRDAETPDGGMVHVHDQPAVEFVGIDVATLHWVDYESIEYGDAATVKPQIRVNGEGVLGVDFIFGGPSRNPSYAVGFLRPDYAAAVAVGGGVADPTGFETSADYLGLAADPEQVNCFVGAGSAVKARHIGTPTGPSQLYDDPHYVVFGRATHCRVPPTTLSDLVVTSVTAGKHDLSVFGAVSPPVAGAEVYVDYTPSVGSTFSHNVLTDAQGKFSDTATVASDQGGRWAVKARWFGKDYYIGDESVSAFVDVLAGSASPSPGQQQTSLTVVCPSATATSFPASVTVTGSLTPAVNASTVVLTYTPPSGPAFVHTVQTAADGSYSDSVVVNGDQIYATWTVQAHFGGDATRTSADASCTFSPHYP